MQQIRKLASAPNDDPLVGGFGLKQVCNTRRLDTDEDDPRENLLREEIHNHYFKRSLMKKEQVSYLRHTLCVF